MRKIITLFLLTSLFLNSYGQDTLDVVEKSIKVGGSSNKIEYYGFADGDKIIFNLKVDNGKELKDVTISEYPGNVKFADHKTENIQNKALNVYRNSVYSFEYYNSNLSGRTIQIKIQRVPKSEKTKFFNTNIKWINKVDTIFTAKQNTCLLSSDTSFVDIIDTRARVHSVTNLNPNKTMIDFTIPVNTIRWTYWIGVGNESQEAFRKDQENFSKSATKIIGSINPLAGLAFNLITMTSSNIGESVKYFFLPTAQDAQNFNAGLAFRPFKMGNVITDFGLMNYAASTNQKYYVGLQNESLAQGIDVNVKILAVVVENKYNTVIEKLPAYINKSIPVIED